MARRANPARRDANDLFSQLAEFKEARGEILESMGTDWQSGTAMGKSPLHTPAPPRDGKWGMGNGHQAHRDGPERTARLECLSPSGLGYYNHRAMGSQDSAINRRFDFFGGQRTASPPRRAGTDYTVAVVG